jgi:hypothetical protein
MQSDPIMSDESAVQRLLDLEAIKQLKARYFLLLDTKQWEAWSQLFTEDLRIEGTIVPTEGRDAFVAGVQEALADVRTCHHGHSPIIELTGPDDAKGIWAMYDDLWFPAGHPWSAGRLRRVGYGHYQERYRREADGWRIAMLRLTRLWAWHDDAGDPDVVEGGVLTRDTAPAWLG